MPEIFREGPYRFFFYSMEGNEPRHVHIEATERTAKYWLEPISLAASRHMNAGELNEVRKIIEKRHSEIISKWNEHFRDRR